MPWYKIEISEKEAEQGKTDYIQHKFADITDRHKLRRAILFAKDHDDDSGRDTLYIYCESSTQAEMLYKSFSLHPCDPPSAPPVEDVSSDGQLVILSALEQSFANEIRASLPLSRNFA